MANNYDGPSKDTTTGSEMSLSSPHLPHVLKARIGKGGALIVFLQEIQKNF